MSRNPCSFLRQAGTAVWLDSLSRSLIVEGRLESLIGSVDLTGLTSNPAIFHKAMTTGSAYDSQIAELQAKGLSDEGLYEHLAVEDIKMACDVLRPVWEETHGADGFVSLEVSPHLARDPEGTARAAGRLWEWVAKPNLLIKVPGTVEGIPVVEELLYAGIGVNVTLLFSVDAYEEVARCYIAALERRAAEGKSLDIPSVASFFVSRIDTLVDSLLERKGGTALALRGQAAVANAKIAYRSFQRIFRGEEFRALHALGALPQRPLWASTSTKNPAYRDVMYVEPLIGRDTVNTMPMETIEAFQDHGVVVPDSVEAGLTEALRHLTNLADLGISFKQVTDQLLDEGIAKFNEPYDRLLVALHGKRGIRS
jgi:transaldolase